MSTAQQDDKRVEYRVTENEARVGRQRVELTLTDLCSNKPAV